MNPNQPLNADELDELENYLLSDSMPETAMDVPTLDGFFAALVLHPDIIMPGEYLPWIWDEEEGAEALKFSSMEEVNHILELIMRHYNSVLEAIDNVEFKPLFSTLQQKDSSDYFDAESWSWGFMTGVTRFPEPWDGVFKKYPELLTPMMLLGTEEGWNELAASGDEKHATQEAYDAIPVAVAVLYDYFRGQRETATEQRMAQHGHQPSGMKPVQNKGNKVGRNEECPCGSGKKFKKCCGAPPTIH